MLIAFPILATYNKTIQMAYVLTIVTLYNVHGYKAGTAVGYILNEPIRNASEQVEKEVAQLVRAPT